VKAGDIIETIDGKPVAEVMDSLRPYIAGSTEAALKDRLLLASLGGKEGSQVRLGLHGRGGKKQVTLTRKRPERPVLDNEDQPYRLLEPGLGYVDLRVLDPGQVDAMFEAMKGTRAIIFDMRGYPRGTAWSIAPRLARKPGTIHAAMFQRRLVSGLEPEEEDTRYLFMQPLPTTEKWKYQGKTFMLINHDTISQAEHTGLFFEAANGTEFIGSNTSGANGDVTTMCLPGDLCVHFTGHDVRHADGRQLQRVGLQPHVRVEPTIAGVRAGKDEVLDAAIEHARARTALP
jgi:C-terminal processing protease CtpA/Prc